ncbi:hypothetical protein V6N13_009071 [Hibiscus sabdariffa]
MEISWGPHPFKWFEHLVNNRDYVNNIREECNKKKCDGIESIPKSYKFVSKYWVSNVVGQSRDSIQELESKCSNLEANLAEGFQVRAIHKELGDSRRRP